MQRFISENDIDQMIVDLVDRTREKYGITPDMSGQEACHCLDIPVLYGDLKNRDGYYEPKSQRIIINQARMGWPPRLEFTIYHEIMHHLLERDGELLESLHEMLLKEDDNVLDRAREDACNAGAAEFLAPRKQVLEIMSSERLTVDLIEHIAGTFGTGLVASAIQVGRCAPVDCYVVICEKGPCQRLPQYPVVFQVEYASWPRWQTRYPLARFSPISKDHLLHDVWTTGLPATDRTYIPFLSGYRDEKKRRPCFGEAKPLGDRVLGLLKLHNQVSENQMVLPI